MRISTGLALMTVVAAAAGCSTSEDRTRQDGLTLGAGNAIAANTVMQMVDPWPAGVQDTDLEVPAQRAASSASDSAAESKSTQGGASDK